MSRLLAWLGATLIGALGWWVGEKMGLFTAFTLSVVGTGLGLFLGRWAATRLLE